MLQILILHGWSDDSDSFLPIGRKLKANGFDTYDIWLADYISKDDDVTVPDVVKRMEEVLLHLVAATEITPPFDMVVHSTGALVARQWLVLYDQLRAPRWLNRLVMLAPANYGSALGSKGKSFLGRVVKGFDNWFQTGTQMLNELELSAPYQWSLALSDVLETPSAPSSLGTTYAVDACLPFVLTGIKGYDNVLMKIVNEDGADGVIRAAAANLSSYGATLDFSKDDANPIFTQWDTRGGLAPYAFRALADEDHGSIKSASGADTLNLVVAALKCPKDAEAYRTLQEDWMEATNLLEDVNVSTRHRFFMLNTFVVDDLGAPVEDHFIEFISPDYATNSAPMVYFHQTVIRDIHQNEIQKACRCFYLDRTELMNGFYALIGSAAQKDLQMSISAAPPGPNSHYFQSTAVGASGDVTLHVFDDNAPEARWLHRYSTHFLKIIIPRRPVPGVFALKKMSTTP